MTDGDDSSRKAPRQVREKKTFTLLSPGKDPEKVVLFDDKRVIFHNEESIPTAQHGHWFTWRKVDETEMLSIVFDFKGSDSIHDLKPHIFYLVVKGVYRSIEEWQILLTTEEGTEDFLRTTEESTEDFSTLQLHVMRTTEENTEDFSTLKLHVGIIPEDSFNKIMLWLHPGTVPALVMFMKSDNNIVYRAKHTSGRVAMSEPNGMWEEKENADEYITCFTNTGKVTNTKTKLRRIGGCIRDVWRAYGDQDDDYTNPKDIKKWHIVMIGLTVTSVTQLS